MKLNNHIEPVEECEDYKGDDPSYPGTYDIYTVYECKHCEEVTFTLDSDLDPSFELAGPVKNHLNKEHPEEL